jgi:hypothetical protein
MDDEQASAVTRTGTVSFRDCCRRKRLEKQGMAGAVSDKVITFPRTNPRRDFDYWLSWVECELSILGHDIAARSYDWRSAFARGLKPEEAAEEAAGFFASPEPPAMQG